jgi:phosphatidylserine decarboxylase
MNSNLFPISQEGFKTVAISVFTVFLLLLLDFEFLAFIAFCTTLFFIYAFRNPERVLPSFDKGSIIAPSDGIVKSIEELTDSEYAYKIVIEGNYLDVAVLRAPSAVTVDSITFCKGTRVSQKSKLFNDMNEYATIVFSDENDNRYKLVHQLKQSFTPLIISLFTKQKLRQSFRYGFMHNGITTLYLPSNFKVNVNIGNELKASESLMGYFS